MLTYNPSPKLSTHKHRKPRKEFPCASKLLSQHLVTNLPRQLSGDLLNIKRYKDLRPFSCNSINKHCFNDTDLRALDTIRNSLFNGVFSEADGFDTQRDNLLTMTIDQFTKLYAFIDSMYTQKSAACRWSSTEEVETVIWNCSLATFTPQTHDITKKAQRPPSRKRCKPSHRHDLDCLALLKIYVSFKERLVTIETFEQQHNHPIERFHQRAMPLILRFYCRSEAMAGHEVKLIKKNLLEQFKTFQNKLGSEDVSLGRIHNAIRGFTLPELKNIEITDPSYNEELTQMVASITTTKLKP